MSQGISNTVIIIVAALCITGLFSLIGVWLGARIVMKARETRVEKKKLTDG